MRVRPLNYYGMFFPMNKKRLIQIGFILKHDIITVNKFLTESWEKMIKVLKISLSLKFLYDDLYFQIVCRQVKFPSKIKLKNDKVNQYFGLFFVVFHHIPQASRFIGHIIPCFIIFTLI